MPQKIVFRAGEATVFAAEGQYTDAMPEILIGAVDGPVGQAFANMMGQTAGHTRMFAIRACNQMVRPATMMVPKVTMKKMAYVDLFGGVVQSATADAVLDCVIEGILPRDQVNDLCIKDPLNKSFVSRVYTKNAPDARRATKVVAGTTMPRSATTQMGIFRANPDGVRLSGRSALSSGLRRGATIRCAGLRASHPGKPAPRPRGTCSEGP